MKNNEEKKKTTGLQNHHDAHFLISSLYFPSIFSHSIHNFIHVSWQALMTCSRGSPQIPRYDLCRVFGNHYLVTKIMTDISWGTSNGGGECDLHKWTWFIVFKTVIFSEQESRIINPIYCFLFCIQGIPETMPSNPLVLGGDKMEPRGITFLTTEL